jgi:hypothetical protein
MNTQKKYQNYSYNELISFSKSNPNRHRELESIEIVLQKTEKETFLDKLGLKGYIAVNMNPVGQLSIISYIKDPQYYSLASPGIRTQLLNELSTELQIKTEELKNTSLSRKRKKIYDLIGSSFNGAYLEDKEHLELFNGLELLCDIQFVLIKEVLKENKDNDTEYDSSFKGEILFSSDPTNWKRDKAVCIVDYRAKWVASPNELFAKNTHEVLEEWLTSAENNGWIVHWTEVNSTKVELVEKLSTLSNWQDTDKKLTKDILAVRLGKINILNVFSSWKLNQNLIL